MVKELDMKIKMISAVNEALEFKLKNPLASEEDVFSSLSKTLSKEKDKDTNLAMIAAISKTYNTFESSKPQNSSPPIQNSGSRKLQSRESFLGNKKQKEIINKLMAELPFILNNIDKK